jgi:cytochrome P450
MELKMAFPALAQRYPEMRLAMPTEQLEYRPLSLVYGVESVPVTLG